MESLQENRPLFYSIFISMGALICLLTGLFPDVSNQFEIVEFPTDVSIISAAFYNIIFSFDLTPGEGPSSKSFINFLNFPS